MQVLKLLLRELKRDGHVKLVLQISFYFEIFISTAFEFELLWAVVEDKKPRP